MAPIDSIPMRPSSSMTWLFISSVVPMAAMAPLLSVCIKHIATIQDVMMSTFKEDSAFCARTV